MSQGSTPVPTPVSARGAGTELWLLRPGPRAELEACLVAFAERRFARILCASGVDERAWAEAFARAAGTHSTSCAELSVCATGATRAALTARAWALLVAALEAGEGPILAVLPAELLGLVVAEALGFPLERAGALRVDPGRAVLLRDDPLGIVLRRSNVRAPELAPGTPLPSGRPEARP